MVSYPTLISEEQAVKINEHIQTNINASIKEGLDVELTKLGEAKQIYDDIQAGIDPTALRENASLEATYGNIKVADLENSEENQEAIYSDFLSMKGLSEAKVKQLVQVAKDGDALLTEATDGLKEIQKEISNERELLRKQAKTDKDAREAKNLKTQGKIKTFVTGTKEIIPGKELTKTEHDQLIKNMTVPVRYADNGRGGQTPISKIMDLRAKDPIAFEMKLNYFITQGFFDEKPKFENLAKSAETNASKKFIQKMNSDKSEATGDPTVQKKPAKEESEFRFPFPTP
jgi:nucleoid DNA-binding protein